MQYICLYIMKEKLFYTEVRLGDRAESLNCKYKHYTVENVYKEKNLSEHQLYTENFATIRKFLHDQKLFLKRLPLPTVNPTL